MKYLRSSHKSHISGSKRSINSFAKRSMKLNWKEEWEKKMEETYVSPIDPKIRKCLICDRYFNSPQKDIRRCPGCAKRKLPALRNLQKYQT